MPLPPHRAPHFRRLCLALIAAACGGCVSAVSPIAPARPVAPAPAVLPLPRDRTGCLPFPGLMTLYATADPARLGVHRYDTHAHYFDPDESPRGIIYTTRAGFLDLAHLRLTIDWTRYCVARMTRAIDRRAVEVSMNGSNGSMFHVDLTYPDGWDDLAPAARQRLASELALRSGERLAYLMLTWHEAASWFGDARSVFDESASAFTWDDVMSHVVGVRVAELALRDKSQPFDAAVTTYLDAQLRSLGAVGPARTQAAVDAIDNVWWAHGRPLKRQFDVGLESGLVTPWLVPGLPFGTDAPAESFAVPVVRTVIGRDCSDFLSVRIEPRIAAAKRMRADLPGRPLWFDADHDLPAVMDVMRAEMRTQFGPVVDVPWPPLATPENAPPTRFAHARFAPTPANP